MTSRRSLTLSIGQLEWAHSHWVIAFVTAIAMSNFLWCLPSLKVNSTIEVNGTHLVADAISRRHSHSRRRNRRHFVWTVLTRLSITLQDSELRNTYRCILEEIHTLLKLPLSACNFTFTTSNGLITTASVNPAHNPARVKVCMNKYYVKWTLARCQCLVILLYYLN